MERGVEPSISPNQQRASSSTDAGFGERGKQYRPPRCSWDSGIQVLSESLSQKPDPVSNSGAILKGWSEGGPTPLNVVQLGMPSPPRAPC